MADLNGRGPQGRATDGDGRDRAQILLVTAFALAVTFVGLALVLNSVIFTENLATRSESTTTSDAITHRNTMETGTEEIIVHVNENISTNETDSYDELEANLTEGFGNVSTVSTRHQLHAGQVVNDTVHYGTKDRGTVIRQTNESRNYTDNLGTEDWTVADGTDGVRSVRMQVLGAELGSGNFVAEFDTPSGTWRLEVEETFPPDDYVRVYEPGAALALDTCPVGPPGNRNPPYWINVSEGTVGGQDCTGLRELRDRGLPETTTVRYEDSNRTTGTYRMVANESYTGLTATLDTSYVDPDDLVIDGQPYLKPGIYATNATVTYRTRTLRYGTEFRALPGGPRDD